MKISLKPTIWIASIVVILGVLTAVRTHSRPTEPPQPAGPPVPLTIAVNSTYIGSGLVLIAAAQGYFTAAGLDVTLQPHTAGITALNAAVAAEADLATVADAAFVFAVLRGQPVAIVATISAETRGSGIVARKDRGIATPADLKGKRIGVTLGASGHYCLDVILTAHLIPSRQVQLVNLKPQEMAEALMSGKVDAVSTWNPYLTESKKAAGENGLLFTPGASFRVLFNIAGRQDFIRQHPAAMQKLTRALLQAERFVADHPAQASTLIANATQLDPASIGAQWNDYRLQVGLDQGLLPLLEDQSRWTIRNGYVEKAGLPNYLDFIYVDALAAVKPAALTIIR